jgi:hypothetical protein
MNKCKSLPFLITFVCLGLSLSCGALSHERMEKDDPLIYLDMENENTYGKDSTIEGINGNAKYFSSIKGNPAYAMINNEESLSELWYGLDFSVEIWVQSIAANQNFNVIASNKDWNSGEIKDFTTHHEFGFSRSSGHNKGWAIICQPDGSWAWNMGDGNGRLDYRPTVPRQQINDGAWQQMPWQMNRCHRSKEALMNSAYTITH